MRGWLSSLSPFPYGINELNNTRARMLDSIYHDIKITLKSHFSVKTLAFGYIDATLLCDHFITFPNSVNH